MVAGEVALYASEPVTREPTRSETNQTPGGHGPMRHSGAGHLLHMDPILLIVLAPRLGWPLTIGLPALLGGYTTSRGAGGARLRRVRRSRRYLGRMNEGVVQIPDRVWQQAPEPFGGANRGSTT